MVVVAGLVLFMLALFRTSPEEPDGSSSAVYWTEGMIEPDTIASVWLLKRFISADCEIRVLPKGEASDKGTPFDMPLVDFSRTRTESTFHVIRRIEGVERPGLEILEQLIDEIEIGGWNREPTPEATALESELRTCVEANPHEPMAAIDAGMDVMDQAYADCRRAVDVPFRP
jgi:hypothetical protein